MWVKMYQQKIGKRDNQKMPSNKLSEIMESSQKVFVVLKSVLVLYFVIIKVEFLCNAKVLFFTKAHC